MDTFIIYAFVAGLGVSVTAGVLGCFVVWRRMAYFGDALAHSALLGIALGIHLNAPLTLATVAVCLVFAALLLALQRYDALSGDTALGILAHSMLALGMIAISLSDAPALDLHRFLFGDILSVNSDDLWKLAAVAGVVFTALFFYWQPLLLLTVSADIAVAESLNAGRLRAILVFLITLTVAVSIQVIGVLLIASFLIIPAAGARLLAKTPEAMALLSAAAGVLATALGLWLSLKIDVPAAPAIVAAAATLTAVAAVYRRLAGE